MKRKSNLSLIVCGGIIGFFIVRKRWSIVHNCFVHPLYTLKEDSVLVDRLHDWTLKRWGK